jgi:hypothetical protein
VSSYCSHLNRVWVSALPVHPEPLSLVNAQSHRKRHRLLQRLLPKMPQEILPRLHPRHVPHARHIRTRLEAPTILNRNIKQPEAGKDTYLSEPQICSHLPRCDVRVCGSGRTRCTAEQPEVVEAVCGVGVCLVREQGTEREACKGAVRGALGWRSASRCRGRGRPWSSHGSRVWRRGLRLQFR